MEFYKMVVKAISGAMENRSQQVREIRYEKGLSEIDVMKEIDALNDLYIGRINGMLDDAQGLVESAKNDWRFD